VIGLAVANGNTLGIPLWITQLIAGFLVLPTVYLIYSLKRYFGLKRALGADHFFEEYTKLPMVTDGIYKYSSNAMYLFGFLALWIPGLVTGSLAALILAAFNQIYIWTHYYFTEKPDMVRIYGPH
jgi:hypothetical protein